MKKNVMFISSEGGHLDELRQINFEKYNYSVVTEKTPFTKNLKNKYSMDKEIQIAHCAKL